MEQTAHVVIVNSFASWFIRPGVSRCRPTKNESASFVWLSRSSRSGGFSLSSLAPRDHPSRNCCLLAISPRFKPMWPSTCRWRNRVYREHSLSWLRFGPGRSTPGRPGWTDLRCPSLAERTDDPVPPSPALVPAQADLGMTLKLLERLGCVILAAGRAVLDVPQGENVDA